MRKSGTQIKCGCKINIGLRIVGKRANGLHELDSFFFPLKNPFDTLIIKEQDTQGFVLHSDIECITGENNILTKTYTVFASAVSAVPGLEVTLYKGIPLGAGLGGGSSDAACLLRYLNENVPSPLSPNDLCNLALTIGSDVPFFLEGNSTRVQGVGERLQQGALDLGPCHLLVVCPSIHINTAWAYKRYDELHASSVQQPVHALTKNNFTLNLLLPNADNPQEILPWNLDNDLELPVMTAHPDLAELKEELFSYGALACGMSGSGSSLYAFFDQADFNLCTRAQAALSEKNHRVFLNRLTLKERN